MWATDRERVELVAVLDGGGQVVCESCSVPRSPFGRARGLLGRADLPRGEGLLLRGVSAIHTLFMRFDIDAVFLDRNQVVVGVDSDLAPWRVASHRRARAVLELSAGEGARRGVRPGQRLDFIATGSRQEESR